MPVPSAPSATIASTTRAGRRAGVVVRMGVITASWTVPTSSWPADSARLEWPEPVRSRRM